MGVAQSLSWASKLKMNMAQAFPAYIDSALVVRNIDPGIHSI